MNKLLSCLAAGALALAASSATAATYTFSFDNVGGTVAGTVSGTIELADGDGTFAATSVIVDTAPAALGYTLSLDFLDPANGYTTDFGNSFTVVGGQITDATFGRVNSTEGLFLSNDQLPDFQTWLNTVGSANQGIGVADFASTTLTFGTLAAVPLPASLPLLLAGLGGFGLMSRRKHAA